MLVDCPRVCTNFEWPSGENGRYIKTCHPQNRLRKTRGLGVRSATCLVREPPEEDGPGSRSVRTDVRCPSKDGCNRGGTSNPILERRKPEDGRDGHHYVACDEER